MKKFNTLLLLIFTLFSVQMEAQQRYLSPDFFDEVTRTDSFVYGVNATVLYFQVTGEAVPQPLYFDFYEPVGDTETARPLVLLFHSGTFLPFPDNGLSNGTMGDSAVVDVATKLAKMGYVVASCDYRLGWNPIAGTQDERVFGIMNAAYRAIQDARTAVRFFKRDAAEMGNNFKIDPNRIVMWGIGTGGYLAMGGASLTDYINDIAILPKFNIAGPNGPVPVVVPQINGDIYGTSVGIAPAGYPFPEGDTLCYPNWVEYDSEFQMSVNMGGAVGDTTWIKDITYPTVSFHVPTDQTTPCETALVVLPPPLNLPIVEIAGSCDYQRMQQKFDNQKQWADQVWLDDITAVANTRNNGLEGLYLMPTDDVENNAPWDWWSDDLTPPNLPNYPLDVPTAKATIDTALAYFAPRACLTLDLGCDLSGIVPVSEIEAIDINLQIVPNPASDYIHFSSKNSPIEHIYVYDLQGRLVKVHTNINSLNFDMQRHSLKNGVYVAQVRFEEGYISKQIIFQD